MGLSILISPENRNKDGNNENNNTLLILKEI